MLDKPIKIGICKGCKNPIYNWDEDNTPRDYHSDGDDYSCKDNKTKVVQ